MLGVYIYEHNSPAPTHSLPAPFCSLTFIRIICDRVSFQQKKKKEMAFNGKSRLAISFTLFTILFTLSTLQCGAAMRPLHGEQLLKKHFPLIESLQQGPVPPSKGSPGTHIPGGSGTSKLNEMNFVGRANRQPPPAFPSSITEQSKASN